MFLPKEQEQLDRIERKLDTLIEALAEAQAEEDAEEEAALPTRNTREDYIEAFSECLPEDKRMHHTAIFDAVEGKLPTLPSEKSWVNTIRDLAKKGVLEKHKDGQYIWRGKAKAMEAAA